MKGGHFWVDERRRTTAKFERAKMVDIPYMLIPELLIPGLAEVVGIWGPQPYARSLAQISRMLRCLYVNQSRLSDEVRSRSLEMAYCGATGNLSGVTVEAPPLDSIRGSLQCQ